MSDKTSAATPHTELDERLMSCEPKNELEWHAHHKIEELEKENKELTSRNKLLEEVVEAVDKLEVARQKIREGQGSIVELENVHEKFKEALSKLKESK